MQGGDRLDLDCIHHHAVRRLRSVPETSEQRPNWRALLAQLVSETAGSCCAGLFALAVSSAQKRRSWRASAQVERLGEFAKGGPASRAGATTRSAHRVIAW